MFGTLELGGGAAARVPEAEAARVQEVMEVELGGLAGAENAENVFQFVRRLLCSMLCPFSLSPL